MPDTQPSPTGNFEVYAADGACWCDLVRGNGAVLLHSRPLRAIDDAFRHVESMRHPDARLKPRMSAQGDFYFTVELREDVLATSVMYEFPADRDHALDLARATIPGAPVILVDEPPAAK